MTHCVPNEREERVSQNGTTNGHGATNGHKADAEAEPERV
jgi:hypothetical protein